MKRQRRQSAYNTYRIYRKAAANAGEARTSAQDGNKIFSRKNTAERCAAHQTRSLGSGSCSTWSTHTTAALYSEVHPATLVPH